MFVALKINFLVKAELGEILKWLSDRDRKLKKLVDLLKAFLVSSECLSQIAGSNLFLIPLTPSISVTNCL